MCIYFDQSDFDHCNPRCSIKDMQPELLCFLDNLRSSVGEPIIINSAYRSKEYEISKGRSGTSSHCKGLAVDIRCCTDQKRLKILKFVFLSNQLLDKPIRVGIASNYIHLDLDDSKPNAVWVY